MRSFYHKNKHEAYSCRHIFFMLNPENRPTTRLHVFSDGTRRIVPTSKRLRHTEAEKKKIQIANLNSEKKREDEKRRSTVWNKVKPLYKRQLLNAEIAELTDLTYQQVARSIGQNKYRPQWNRVRTPSNNRRIDAWRLRKESKFPLSESKKLSIQFAKSLVASGLITEGTSKWRQLRNFYWKFGRKLPKSNFDKLRLEVFLQAVKRQRYGRESRLLSLYDKLGNEIGNEWFKTSLFHDESFIRTKYEPAGFADLMHNKDDSSEKRAKIRMMIANRENVINYRTTVRD
jgi:hypothetical protein